jgi:hypothetical protein
MFVFDVLCGMVGSPNLLSLVNVITPRYRTQCGDFLRIDFHRTNYGVHEPLNDAVRHFNEVAGLFDFHLSWNQFFNHLSSVCVRPFIRDMGHFYFVVSIYLRFELLILALSIKTF